jgi:hypothetical protein
VNPIMLHSQARATSHSSMLAQSFAPAKRSLEIFDRPHGLCGLKGFSGFVRFFQPMMHSSLRSH